jgi:FKBP-type peptidyl-prolyl cis-trans isomerase
MGRGRIFVFALGLGVVGCTPAESANVEAPAVMLRRPEPALSPKDDVPVARTLANGEDVLDLRFGDGPLATKGAKVVLGYVGTRSDGVQFATSEGKPEPFAFTLGEPWVNAIWELGVTGMRRGGVRRIWIPPELINGGQGRGEALPPGMGLIFDVELLDVQ